MNPFDPLHGPLSLPLARGWQPSPSPVASQGIAPSRSVRIADLSAAKKRQLWLWIQENDAATAAQLTGPDVRTLMEAFPGSSPVLDVAYVEKALSW